MFLFIATLFTTISCSTEVEHEIAQVASPTLVSTTPVTGTSGIQSGNVTISLTYDKNVFLHPKIKIYCRFLMMEVLSVPM